jgi:hypothetical protein
MVMKSVMFSFLVENSVDGMFASTVTGMFTFCDKEPDDDVCAWVVAGLFRYFIRRTTAIMPPTKRATPTSIET